MPSGAPTTVVTGSPSGMDRTAGALGDEAAVMMISGLGAAEPASPWADQATWAAARQRYTAWAQAANTPGVTSSPWVGPIPPATWPGAGTSTSSGAATGAQGPSLSDQLAQVVTLGSISLPLWGWLVLAALLGGAGGYYFGGKK